MTSSLKAILAGLAAIVLLSWNLALAGPYLDSAHGDGDYGVLWTTGAFSPRGNCGNCHVQHDSVDGDQVPDGGPFEFGLFYYNYVGLADK